MKRLLSAFLVLASCCKSAPPPPACSHDSNCPVGQACFAGSCRSLSQVLQNLSVVVEPHGSGQAPQEYRSVDATQPTVNLDLNAPQILQGAFVLPPTCLPNQALPIQLRFTGHPFIPLLDWTFEFETDAAGSLQAALPSGETFDEWIVPILPCAAPLAGKFLSLPGTVDVGTILRFPAASDVLTVAGIVSAPGAGQPLVGASVVIRASQGPIAGTALSTSTLTVAGSPIGFVLPVPLAQVEDQSGQDGGSCVLPPLGGDCDGGPCPPLEPCVVFTLEIGPSAEQPLLPTIEVPVAARLTPAARGGDGGFGPTLRLLGDDGLGLRLPIGPGGVAVAGIAQRPGGQPLPDARVEVSGSVIAPPGSPPGCAQGCAVHVATTTVLDGSFSLTVPPGGSYQIALIPPPGVGLAPVTFPLAPVGAAVLNLDLVAAAGAILEGSVVDPTGATAIEVGEVQALSLSTGQLVAATALSSPGAPGTFSLVVPPGNYLLVIHPDDSTGLPDRSLPIMVAGSSDLGTIALFQGARLQGSVFAEPNDGGVTLPVGFALLRLFFVAENSSFGTVALPIAAGVTDPQGHFSVAVPSAAAEQ